MRENALKSLARAIILIRLKIIMFFLKRLLPNCQFIFVDLHLNRTATQRPLVFGKMVGRDY